MSSAHFAARGPVVDALADEPIEAIDGEATPRHAGGENERSCPYFFGPSADCASHSLRKTGVNALMNAQARF